MPGDLAHITPTRVNREFVRNKCDYFLDVQLWPIRSRLNPAAWLSNFSDAEMDYAVQLLHGFMYFNRHLVEQLFKAAFHDLSTDLFAPHLAYRAVQSRWRTFNDTVLITRVTGETPSETDSGFLFSRMARQVLTLPEEHVLAPEAALATLLRLGPTPLVFVDDFVGSGQQFIRTWQRLYDDVAGAKLSFERLAAVARGDTFYYCPLICTERGCAAIRKACPQVHIRPAHLIPRNYSALVRDSVLWPAELLRGAARFIRDSSRRAGIPPDSWQGFANLGLTIAFDHGVPDATLPLFYWEQNGWSPLVQRT